MNREQLISAIAEAIADEEGFFVAEAEARRRGIKFPTLPQRLCNPGDVRRWKLNGKAYPDAAGYVDFLAWAKGDPNQALLEGWRVLYVIVGQYIDGAHHNGRSPSLLEMFAVYAPAEDKNDPGRYALAVAERAGIPADAPLNLLCS